MGVQAVEVFFVAMLGLVLGSFSSALIYRVPRGISWGAKRSYCPSCNNVLEAKDLIPLFSWCLNKGKCRYCKTDISAFYPFVEILCAGLCLVGYSVYGLKVDGLCLYAALPFLLALFFIDIKHMILPNQLIFVLFVIGILRLIYFWSFDGFSVLAGGVIMLDYVLAAILFSLLSWGTGVIVGKILKKESLGFGDVKFFGLAGLWLGLEKLPFFMIFSGAVAIVFALFWRHIKKSEFFPFGPALILVFIIMLFYQGLVVT